MNRALKILLAIAIICVLCIAGNLYYLTTLTATETYPDDNYFATETNKTALIIVAHDDDAIASAGTIANLCKTGWTVREMCFYQAGGLHYEKNNLKNPIRKKSLANAAVLQGIAGVDAIDFNFRNDMQTEKPYMPMPYEDFPRAYKIDSLNMYIASYIEQYQPSVIFTLDDSIGGYGHPDHVLISRLVLEYCRAHQNDSAFSVRKIYQAVFSPSLSEKIMKDSPTYLAAKEVYQREGMPLPDVQVNITEYGDLKKKVMLEYVTEHNSLKKIWPFYKYYPGWIYFRIFDREFFRVIELGN